MKRLERQHEKGCCVMMFSKQIRTSVFLYEWKKSDFTHEAQSVFTPTPPTPSPSLYLCLPSLSTFCPLPLASFHLFLGSSPLSLTLPATPVLSYPRRRRGLIIISQARPHQETWLLMREKSIPLSLSPPSLCLNLSILSLRRFPPLPLFF